FEPRIPIYDDAGEEIFDIEAAESVADVASVRAIALATEIVKAVNMHDRLVAYLADNLPKCSYRCARNYSCDGCQAVCEEGQLLKEARGDK
ncbi:unnamed protein product, partial [marine sediment metagenome]